MQDYLRLYINTQLETYARVLQQWSRTPVFALQRSMSSYFDAYRGILRSRVVEASEGR